MEVNRTDTSPSVRLPCFMYRRLRAVTYLGKAPVAYWLNVYSRSQRIDRPRKEFNCPIYFRHEGRKIGIYIYTYTHTHTHIYMYIHLYIVTHTLTHTYIFVFIYMLFLQSYIQMYIYIYMCVCVCVYV